MHRTFLWLARAMAILGGITLCALILITCASIVGRTLNTILHYDALAGGVATWLLGLGIGPIKGDVELLEAGMAFTIFAFLPLAQMTNGHASVDIFTDWLPRRTRLVLRMVIEWVFAAALVVIAVQLNEGLASKARSGQTSLLLQFPVWWGYAGALVGATVTAIVAIYMAGVRTAEAATGRTLLADEQGADH